MSGAVHRRRRSTPTEAALRDVLVQIAGNYHLILIDCLPGEEELQRMAQPAAATLSFRPRPTAAASTG